MNLAQLLDSNLEELIDLLRKVEDPVLRIYGEILRLYLQGNVISLRSLLDSLPAQGLPLRDLRMLQSLGRARLRIREKTVDRETLNALEACLELFPDWKCETEFLIAMAYESLEDHGRAKEAYEKAVGPLEKEGAPKKAAKAALNAIACESHIFPDRKLFAEYHQIARQGIRVGASDVAGIAFLNISREYQLLGARLAALKYVNRAISLLQGQTGTRPYFMAIAHRCHVFLELGRREEAQIDFEMIRMSPLPEAQGTIEVLEKLISKTSSSVGALQPLRLTPTWEERWSHAQNHETRLNVTYLAPLEDRLVQFLSRGPKDKFEIIQFLYENKGAFASLDRRLTNLLVRVRKKHPGLLVFSGGKYRISDEVYLPIEKASREGA